MGSAALSPDGKWLALSGQTNPIIYIFDVQTARVKQTFEILKFNNPAMVFSKIARHWWWQMLGVHANLCNSGTWKQAKWRKKFQSLPKSIQFNFHQMAVFSSWQLLKDG